MNLGERHVNEPPRTMAVTIFLVASALAALRIYLSANSDTVNVQEMRVADVEFHRQQLGAKWEQCWPFYRNSATMPPQSRRQRNRLKNPHFPVASTSSQPH